jgi:hypothetical protein
MRLLFWKPQKAPVGATVDEAALMQRVNRVMPLLVEAGLLAMERDPKSAKKLIRSFRQMADLADSLNGEQLSLLLDCIEASMPEELKERLRG